jgi:hypothetical protein
MAWCTVKSSTGTNSIFTLSRNLTGVIEENRERPSQVRRSEGEDSKPGTPEYEAGAVLTTLHISILWFNS